jgi:heme exporter protein D
VSGSQAQGGATGASVYGNGDNGQPDVANRSVGELIGEVTRDLSTLMRQELELAKAEVKQEAAKAGKGAGMLAGAGIAGHLMLIFLSLTLVYFLFTLFGGNDPADYVWAALIVTVLWGIVAAVLAMSGRKQLQQVNPKPEQTVQSLKEDAEWLKTQNR